MLPVGTGSREGIQVPGNNTSWVAGGTENPKNVYAPRSSCLEQLELRVLLSADFGGIESALGVGTLSRESAVFIDVDPDLERTGCQITITAEQHSRQVVFVDPSIDQSEVLLGELSSTSEPSTRVVYLDGG
jgi:hypothetical protein